MGKSDITIVMSPREQFALTQRSLESLFANTNIPFEFICIDARSPRKVRDYLRRESELRGFKLIRKEYHLSPTEARNLVLDEIQTKYVVYIDNDVVFQPKWLEYLLQCAEETGAAVVSPLICIGEPAHVKIHMAGADFSFVEEDGERTFHESHRLVDHLVSESGDLLARKPTDLAEFHCMFIRTDMLKKIGRFDEGFRSIADHTDFCMAVKKHGGLILIEPQSIITQIFGPPLALSDLKLFYYRWSDTWTLDSERHLHKKLGTVCTDAVYHEFVLERRRHALPRFRAFAKSIIGWRRSERLLEIVADIFTWLAEQERRLAHYITQRTT